MDNKLSISDSFIFFILVSAFLGVAISFSHIYLFHVSLFVLILALLVPGKFSYMKPATMYHGFFAFFFSWYLLSILWSASWLYAVKYVIYIFLGTGIVFLIVFSLSTKERLVRLFKLIAIFSVINLITGVLEVQTSFRMPVSPFSQLLGLVGRPELNLEGYTERQIVYLMSMPTGFNWNPNNYSVFVNMALPFFLLHRKKVIKIPGAALCFFLIIKAGSRGNMVAFFVILFFSFLLNREGRITILSFSRTLILGLLFYLGVFFLLPVLLDRFSITSGKIYELITIKDALKVYLDFGSSGSSSIGIRGQLILNGIRALSDSYFLGVGAGNSLVIQQQLGMKTLSMHNFWIELLVEGGLFFFIVFILWYFRLTCKLLTSRFENGFFRYLSRCFFIMQLGFLFSAISASSTIYFLPMYIMFGFSISLVNLSCKEKTIENSTC